MRLIQETYYDGQGEEALTYCMKSAAVCRSLGSIVMRRLRMMDWERGADYYFHNDVCGVRRS